jgi:hypothetical protein
MQANLVQSRAKRGQPAGSVAAHRAAADAHRRGDLALGQARVIAEHDRLALPDGQAGQRGPGGGLLQQTRALVPGAWRIRQCPPRTVAGDGPVPQHGPGPVHHGLAQVSQGPVLVPQPMPAPHIATKASCTTSSAVAASRISNTASRTSAW